MTKSPRRLKQQVQDTVGEQVRDLPLHAVRLAMFGVGRALLLSDRVTRDYKEMREGGVGPVLGRLRDDAQHAAGKVVDRVATLVRGGEEAEEAPWAAETPVATPPKPRPRAAARPEISVGKPAAKPAPEPTAEAAPKPAPEPSPKPAAQARPEPEAEAEQPKAAPEPQVEMVVEPVPDVVAEAEARVVEKVEADLPVPNYDQATLPQLRARLRGLSLDQVRLLREYERQHAARAEVLRMYENRINKLNGNS
jgi:hypothetical protein